MLLRGANDLQGVCDVLRRLSRRQWAIAQVGDRACLQLPCPGLEPGPGLELMKGVAGRVGIVVLGYLGQFGAMEAGRGHGVLPSP